MNFHQIQRRFECLEVKAGYTNHKYNPLHKKVSGLKQHIYQDELLLSNKLDLEVYAKQAFLSKDEEAEAEFKMRKTVQTKEKQSRKDLLLHNGSNLTRSRSKTATISSNNFSREQLRSGRINNFNPNFVQNNDPLLSLSSQVTNVSQKPQSAKDPRRHIIAKCTMPTQMQIQAAQLRQQKLREEKIAVVKIENERPAGQETVSADILKSLYRIKIPDAIINSILAREPIEEIIKTTKKIQFLPKSSPSRENFEIGKNTTEPQTMKNADIGPPLTFPSPLNENSVIQKMQDFTSTLQRESMIYQPELNGQGVDAQLIKSNDKSYFNLADSANSKVITRDKNNRNIKIDSQNVSAAFSDQVLKSGQFLRSSGTNEPLLKSQKDPNGEIMMTRAMIFNLKITDLTMSDNPFVVFNDREIDSDGYLVIEEQQSSCLPWLENSSQIQKRTLKIEVKFKGMLILLRFIHLDKLYDQQYQKIALQIVNNMIQDNIIEADRRIVKEDGYCRLQCGQTEINKLIQSLNSFQLHISDLKGVLLGMGLKLFPQFMKETKVIVEFSDCILQANDLFNYTIIIDETGNRNQQSKREQQTTMQPLLGQRMQKNIRVDEYGIIYEGVQRKPTTQDRNVQEYVRTVSMNAKARSQVLMGTRSKIHYYIKNQVKEPSAADMKDQLQVFQHLYPHSIKTMSLQPQLSISQGLQQSKVLSAIESEQELRMVFQRNTSKEIIIKTKAQGKDYGSRQVRKVDVLSQCNQVLLPEILEQKSVSETQNLSRNGSPVQQPSEMRSPIRDTLRGHSKEPSDAEYHRGSFFQLKQSDYQQAYSQQQDANLVDETYLSPQSSFLFRGSQARKLVEDLLHTRDRNDPLTQLRQKGIIF